MKKEILLPILLLLVGSSYSGKAQSENSISGNLKNTVGEILADGIIQLFKLPDSALVKTEFTDDKGNFKFEGVANENYFVVANVLGYKTYSGEAFVAEKNTELAPIQLQKGEVILNEVTITTRKPYIEREHGKMIVNVENSMAAAGNSAFEVIEKSPGIKIDNNDNISYKGKQGVAVWIDGKPTPMTGSDLANYLRGISAAAIEKIEYIANPSAKYDAAGSAIINIKLKKDKRLGTNASVTLAYGQGVYPKSNNGFTFNHRNSKLNLYVSYNNAFRTGYNRLRLDRNFYTANTFQGAYQQNNYLVMDFKNHLAKIGLDYTINDKNSVGISINGANNRFNPTGSNISEVYDNTNTYVSHFETNNLSKDWWYNNSLNLNYKHIFDTAGTELTADLDYAHFGNQTQQNFTTRYFDLSNQEYQNPYLLFGDINGGLDIYAFKTDYTKPLRKDMRLEAGLKTSYVIADNNLAFYDQSSGVNVYDSSKSNHFIYTENINAAYSTLTKDWKKINAQLGLRVENTHVIGNQLVYHSVYDTSYTQLFPSALIAYKASEKHSIEFNYSRRIERPGYDQLNPFKYYLDPTTYKAGNPYLQPQTTHSFEITHVFNQKIITSLGYGRTSKNITEVLAPDPNQQKLIVQTNYNLARVDVYSANLSVPTEIYKWWYTSNDVNLYYAGYSGNIANTTIRNAGSVNLTFNSVNTFNVSSTFSAELSGNYRAREVYAFETIRPIWYINMGLQKKFANGKALIKFAFNDIFHSYRVRATVIFNGYTESYDVRRDTQVATLSFTYKFGSSTFSGASRRKGGADDIKQRAGGNVG